MGIYGQDWASYQSASPATTGLSFVIIKTTEGTSYINPEWRSQMSDAQNAGLVLGFYAYPHMRNDPAVEANFFLANLPILSGDMLALDWEGFDANNQGLTYTQMNTYKTAWVKHVKSALPHVPVGVYCTLDYANNSDKYFGDFLWIADPNNPMGHPNTTLPWTFQQYSSAGNVDHDYSNFNTKQDLINWINNIGEDMTPDQANQLTNVYDATFFGGASCGVTPPGAANNSLVAKLDAALATTAALTTQLNSLTATVNNLVNTLPAAVAKAVSLPVDAATLGTDVATDLKADLVTALGQ